MITKGSISYYFTVVIVTIVATCVLLVINRIIFDKLTSARKREYLHLIFFRKINAVIITFVCCLVGLSFFNGIESVWQSVLGGTAIISAVLVFAAQDVIKDTLAGLMISIYKPFEIGNRIELENGQSGIVRDITMRHTVIHTWGSQELIIPNSKLNTLTILNDSYHTGMRSFQAKFQIGYGSDVKKAMSVIKNAIIDSPYTVGGKKVENDRIYDDVYFMAYEPSSLRMETTVYYKGVPTEIVRSDVNIRVNEALKANGIEIPYTYVNVIQK